MTGQLDSLLAKWTLQLLLEPVVDALRMELVRALQGLDHLAGLQVVQADGAGVFVVGQRLFVSVFTAAFLLLFILEARNGVDDVLDLIWRWQWNAVLVQGWLLFPVVLFVVGAGVSVEAVGHLLDVAVEEELLLLLLVRVTLALLRLLWTWLEHVAVEVDLDAWTLVLQPVQQDLHVVHDPLQVEEVVWVVSLALPVVLPPGAFLVHACGGSSLAGDAGVLQGLVQEGLESWVRWVGHARWHVGHSIHAVCKLRLLELRLVESLVLVVGLLSPLV